MRLERDRLAASAARSLAVARQWRGQRPHVDLARHFARVATASAGEIAAAAVALLADPCWVGELLAPLVAALRDDPWFEPPFRVSRDGLRIGTVLFDAPGIAISATVLRADMLAVVPPPRTVVIPGRLTVTRYLHAGGARLRRWQADPISGDFSAADAPPCREIEPVVLHDGRLLVGDGRCQGQLLAGATDDVATVTATVRCDPAPFMREYAIEGGALVRVGMLDERGARTDMLRSLLRHLGRADAGDCFDAATRDPAFFRRWSAMREWLALDAAAACSRLRQMAAEDPHPEVRAAARATLPMVEARLAQGVACPA